MEHGGLICAFDIDDTGAAHALDAMAVNEPIAAGHWRWLHFERTSLFTEQWLKQHSKLTPDVISMLLAAETRPRLKTIHDDAVLILRGVNLNPLAEPEDMIAVRVSVENNRIITTRQTKLMAINAIRTALNEGYGPATIGDFVVLLTDGLIERVGPIITDLSEVADDLEEFVNDEEQESLRNRISHFRHKIIPLRRYLGPQRDALYNLIAAPFPWLTETHKTRLRDILDLLTRYIEDLDAMRDRADVIQDWLTAHLSDRMNRIILLLSVVTTIFLPLGLISGLLGMNVGGIPGSEYKYSFMIIIGLMVGLIIFMLWIFRRNKII